MARGSSFFAAASIILLSCTEFRLRKWVMRRHAQTYRTPASMKSYLEPIRSDDCPITEVMVEDYSEEGWIRSFHMFSPLVFSFPIRRINYYIVKQRRLSLRISEGLNFGAGVPLILL